MKLSIGFKTPDAIHYALDEYRDYSGESDDGEELTEEQKEEAREKLERWIRYGESVTIEFDLDKMTAKVAKIG
jgi:hypothetical protein